MIKKFSFTEEECKGLCDLIEGFVGRLSQMVGDPESVFELDGMGDFSKADTRAAAKLYAACGKSIPLHLKTALEQVQYVTYEHEGVLGEDIHVLGLPYGVESRLKQGHIRSYHQTNPMPQEVKIVHDLCQLSYQELVVHGLPGASVDSIRAALEKHGLKLRGE